jgi:predicted ArsR family transcriptional regulator
VVERAPIDLVAESRRTLLAFLKNAGWSTIPKIAEALSISTEAVRQQLLLLEKDGWVQSNCGPGEHRRARGRPAVEYCLSHAAEDLFIKQYPQLAVEFFDAIEDQIGFLTRLTDERVRDVGSAERLESIYADDDPYTSMEKSADGYRLIERNCPYLQFAMERPLFCSSTVSALRRLSGCEVVREKRFQDGDGRCVFHIDTARPLSEGRKNIAFEIEPNRPA